MVDPTGANWFRQVIESSSCENADRVRSTIVIANGNDYGFAAAA